MKKAAFIFVFVTSLFASSYTDGLRAYSKGDYKKAFELFEPLAKKGNVNAQNRLGMMYNKGLGVKQDIAMAKYWYKKAAALGDTNAKANLYTLYDSKKEYKDKNSKIKYFHEVKHADPQSKKMYDFSHGTTEGMKKDSSQKDGGYMSFSPKNDGREKHTYGVEWK